MHLQLIDILESRMLLAAADLFHESGEDFDVDASTLDRNGVVHGKSSMGFSEAALMVRANPVFDQAGHNAIDNLMDQARKLQWMAYELRVGSKQATTKILELPSELVTLLPSKNMVSTPSANSEHLEPQQSEEVNSFERVANTVFDVALVGVNLSLTLAAYALKAMDSVAQIDERGDGYEALSNSVKAATISVVCFSTGFVVVAAPVMAVHKASGSYWASLGTYLGLGALYNTVRSQFGLPEGLTWTNYKNAWSSEELYFAEF